jgi:hypothetical protein
MANKVTSIAMSKASMTCQRFNYIQVSTIEVPRRGSTNQVITLRVNKDPWMSSDVAVFLLIYRIRERDLTSSFLPHRGLPTRLLPFTYWGSEGRCGNAGVELMSEPS